MSLSLSALKHVAKQVKEEECLLVETVVLSSGPVLGAAFPFTNPVGCVRSQGAPHRVLTVNYWGSR